MPEIGKTCLNLEIDNELHDFLQAVHLLSGKSIEILIENLLKAEKRRFFTNPTIIEYFGWLDVALPAPQNENT
jgi:hypothetical protein